MAVKKILTELQEKILQIIGAHQKVASSFYLSGGTALAGFYLFHRYSEDLDFFSENEFAAQGITVFLRKRRENSKEIIHKEIVVQEQSS